MSNVNFLMFISAWVFHYNFNPDHSDTATDCDEMAARVWAENGSQL